MGRSLQNEDQTQQDGWEKGKGKGGSDGEDDGKKPKFNIDDMFNEIKTKDNMSNLRRVGSPSKRNRDKVPFWVAEAAAGGGGGLWSGD